MSKHIHLILIAFLINCASSSAGISTSNIPIVNKKYKVISPVEGIKSWVTLDVAVFAVSFSNPPINELVEEMLRSKEADALINIRYWQDKRIYLFITLNRLGINAEAVKFTDEAQTEPNAKKTR